MRSCETRSVFRFGRFGREMRWVDAVRLRTFNSGARVWSTLTLPILVIRYIIVCILYFHFVHMILILLSNTQNPFSQYSLCHIVCLCALLYYQINCCNFFVCDALFALYTQITQKLWFNVRDNDWRGCVKAYVF